VAKVRIAPMTSRTIPVPILMTNIVTDPALEGVTLQPALRFRSERP
jgi:hypothetical protein